MSIVDEILYKHFGITATKSQLAEIERAVLAEQEVVLVKTFDDRHPLNYYFPTGKSEANIPLGAKLCICGGGKDD